MSRFASIPLVALLASCLFTTALRANHDSDRDGLSDERELELGTRPEHPDSDGDGLLDGWEVLGYELDGFVEPLPSYGCDPLRKDVLVEIDWMESSGRNRFQNALIAYQAAVDVWRVFEGSGTGIRIHFDLGADIEAIIPPELQETGPEFQRFRVEPDRRKMIPHQDRLPARPLCPGATNVRSLYEIYYDQDFFRPSRRNIFYYVVFAEQHESDLTDTTPAHPFSDSFADELSRRAGLKPAGTQVGAVFRRPRPSVDPDRLRYNYSVNLLHELGHAFGLGHGGTTLDQQWDNTNNKPNYPSIMNYRFQFWGVRLSDGQPVMDFSHGEFIPLKERELLEVLGLGPVPNDRFLNDHLLANLGVRHLTGSGFPANLDWDANGQVTLSAVSRDLDFDRQIDAEPFRDHDDWGTFVRLGFAGIGLRAFEGCGLSCAVGQELLRFPGDFDGDGRTDLFLLHGRTGALALTDVSGGLNVPARLVYVREIPGHMQAPSWSLSAADEILVADLDGDGSHELLLHRRNKVGVVNYLEEGLFVVWGGEESERAGASSWRFSRRDQFLQSFRLRGGGSAALLVSNGSRATVLGWKDGLEARWVTAEPMRRLTGGEPAYVETGRSDPRGGGTFFIRSAHALVEVDARAADFTARRLDRDGVIPAESPNEPGWPLSATDCLLPVDLDGDGNQEVLLKSTRRIGVLREQGASLLLAWSAKDQLEGWPIREDEFVHHGQFIPGGGEEVLVSRGSSWLALSWNPTAAAMRTLAVATDFLPVPRGGNTGWKLRPRQQLTIGRFLEGEGSLILAQDDGRVLLARLTQAGFETLEVFEGMIGSWSLSREDSMWEVNADLDTQVELSIKKGYLLGVLDLSSQPDGNLLFSARFDIEKNSLAPVALFLRGDTNNDRRLDVSDVITLLQFLFLGNTRIACLDAADTDDSGELDISDALRLLGFLFAGTLPPPPPGPKQPGIDPTLDALPCD